MSQRDFHPVAEIFPLLEGAAFADLVNDIRQHGQREPITLHPDGRIVDGRNRYRACVEIGESPAYRTWHQERDGDLVAYVVSLNLRRRHLDEGQRAMAAAKIANLPHGVREDRPANLPVLPVTQAQAAELLNVGERSVRAAKAVLRDGVPELAAEVQRGAMPVSVAEAISKVDPEQQRQILAEPPRERKRAAVEIRKHVSAVMAEPSAPEKVLKDAGSVRERRDRMRQMAAEGYSASQIADALGLDEQTIRNNAKEEGIAIIASKVLGRQRRHDAARIMEHIVSDADNLTADIHLIAFAELSRDQLGAWIQSLERSRRKLSEFISTLKKEHQKHGEAA